MNTEQERTELLPCPFCGAGTTEVRENGRPWLGTKGWGEPVSVSVRHWCDHVDGQPSRMIERVGRDRTSAIDAWNRRAALQSQEYTAAIGEAGQAYLDRFKNAHALPAEFRWSELWAVMCVAANKGRTDALQSQDREDAATEATGGDENGGHRLVEPDHETALALADAPRSLRNYVAALRSAIAAAPTPPAGRAALQSQDREDAARLDWLDSMNAKLNSHYGTTYRWELVLSPHVVRLMAGYGGSGHVAAIDLNDSAANGVPSCREAIDHARCIEGKTE